MKNFVQAGDMLDLVAPSGGVTSGVGVKIGAIFAVAAEDALIGVTFAGAVRGVFDLLAEAHATDQAMAIGDTAYWDNTAEQITKTATGNTAVGVVVATKVSTAVVARVVLTPRVAAGGAAITNITTAAVTGVNGTGNNAASKADVDTAFTAHDTKINAIISALEAAGVIVA